MRKGMGDGKDPLPHGRGSVEQTRAAEKTRVTKKNVRAEKGVTAQGGKAQKRTGVAAQGKAGLYRRVREILEAARTGGGAVGEYGPGSGELDDWAGDCGGGAEKERTGEAPLSSA